MKVKVIGDPKRRNLTFSWDEPVLGFTLEETDVHSLVQTFQDFPERAITWDPPWTAWLQAEPILVKTPQQ